MLRLFHFMHYVNNKICYCSMETIILIVFLSHVDFMFYFVYHSRVLHSFKIVLLLLIFYIRYDLLLVLSLMSNSIHPTSCMKIFCKLEYPKLEQKGNWIFKIQSLKEFSVTQLLFDLHKSRIRPYEEFLYNFWYSIKYFVLMLE